MDIHAQLSDGRTYVEQIERIHQKHLLSSKLYTLQQDGVPLAAMIQDRKRLGRLLARSVGRGKYRFQPAQVREINVNNKQRIVYLFCQTDLIVQSTLAGVLNQALEPLLTEGVYSFRPGKSWHQAVGAFARFLRDHRNERPDPKTRGVYVLRRDVKKYAENVPLEDDSPLWPMLGDLLAPHWGRGRRQAMHWDLIRRAIQPECRDKSGEAVQPEGIPTGAPIAPPLLNLYLMPLDKELAAEPGAFYARYGDDFLFAHADPEVVRRVERRIDEILAELRLTAHNDKNCSLFMNGAARSSGEWIETQGATSVAFLGCVVHFDGTISLTKQKMRELLRDLKRRARRTRKAIPGATRDEVGRAVSAVINNCLDPQSPLAHKTALPLRTVVTDRPQLKQLDYQIARIVLRAVTGDAGVRAFRKVPYRTLRSDWRLISLFERRNRCGRARGKQRCAA